MNTYVERFVPIFDNPLHGTGDEDVLRLNYSLKNFYIWGNRIYLRRTFVPDFDDPLRGTGDEDVGHKCVPLQHGVYCILVYWYVICFLLTWIIKVPFVIKIIYFIHVLSAFFKIIKFSFLSSVTKDTGLSEIKVIKKKLRKWTSRR